MPNRQEYRMSMTVAVAKTLEETERENLMKYQNPEMSVYYHPILNPYGAPPPGQAPAFRKSPMNSENLRLEGGSNQLLQLTGPGFEAAPPPVVTHSADGEYIPPPPTDPPPPPPDEEDLSLIPLPDEPEPEDAVPPPPPDVFPPHPMMHHPHGILPIPPGVPMGRPAFPPPPPPPSGGLRYTPVVSRDPNYQVPKPPMLATPPPSRD
eukprot:TRINITY_DN3021_c0_g1_i2.p1 TRINITY_DN3021_c0_g1~~TRINITY_DN3021_c0_g1_i2.p1  ORF type:complete len:207 (-),score=68.95 TRINITY_DN3021_c0_g1_i2:32-652(-)